MMWLIIIVIILLLLSVRSYKKRLNTSINDYEVKESIRGYLAAMDQYSTIMDGVYLDKVSMTNEEVVQGMYDSSLNDCEPTQFTRGWQRACLDLGAKAP